MPGGEPVQAAGVELLLAEAVVEPDAGALRDHPRAVARRHRHRARAAVAVGRRDVRRRARTRAPRDGRGRRARGTAAASRSRSSVWSSTSSRCPSTARCTRMRCSTSSLSHSAYGRPSSMRSIAVTHTPPTDGGGLVPNVQSPTVLSSDGRTTGRYAARSSGPRMPPRAITSVADQPGQVAGVQGAGALVGDQLERADEIGQHDQVGRDLAVLVVHRGVALVVPAEDQVVHVLEVVARRRAQPEAAAGHVDRRCDDLAPRQAPPARVGGAEGRDRAVRGDRAGADRRGHPVAVVGVDVPRAAAEVTATARHLHPAVDGLRRAAVLRLDRDEAARAQRHDPDLVDHRHEDGGEGGVDGIAPAAGDLLAGIGGGLVGRGDRDVRHPRRLLAPRGPAGRVRVRLEPGSLVEASLSRDPGAPIG